MILDVLELLGRMDSETVSAFIRDHKDELTAEDFLSVCGGAGFAQSAPDHTKNCEDDLFSLAKENDETIRH